MDQLQSAKSALQNALAEVESAIASLSMAPVDNDTSQEGSETRQLPPQPSKASLNINREDYTTETKRDPRYQQDKWIRPKPSSGYSCFSGNLVQWAADVAPIDNDVEYPILTLRHREASRCTVREECETGHWELIHERKPTRLNGCLDLQLVCMRTEHAEKSMTSCPTKEFRDGQDSITIPPCTLFNDLLPDFSSVEEAGYEVVLFRLTETWEESICVSVSPWTVWMDSHGRLLRDMDAPDWS
ncbi:hypothetical protein F52700_870 [Fusarium sp. NRRL 52700]|nr:hypothetical protein F52700_870 [Fusarium sp. NRRL 52700]